MRGIVVLIAVGTLLLVAPVLAQPPPQQTPQQKQADLLFTEGRELIKKADYKGACEKFEQAIALDPSAPGVMLNLGLCNEKLGKLKTSLKWYGDAQIAASSAKLVEYEEAARERTAALLTKVPNVKIVIARPPPDVEVRISGERVGPPDYGKFDLDPGSHELVATAAGKRTYKHSFEIKEGQQQVPIAIPVFEDIVTTTVIIDHGRTRRLVAYGLAGAGVIAIGVSGFLANSAKNEWIKDGQIPADKDVYERKQLIATSIFIGGLALVGGGVVLWLTAPKAEQRTESAFSPVIGPDRLGFAYSRGF